MLSIHCEVSGVVIFSCRGKLHEFFPKHFCRRSLWKSLTNSSENPEYKLSDAHRRATEKFKNTDAHARYQHYLTFLRKFPYYGYK